MKTSKKIIIIASAVVPISLTAYLILRGIRVRNYYKQLMDILNKNETGTTKDIKEGTLTTGSNNWSSVTYWATANPTLKNNASKYQDIADTLWSQIHNMFVSANSVYQTILKIKTQAESSYVSKLYVQETDKILNKVFDTQTLLQGIQSIDQNVSKQIVNYLSSLPLK